MRIRDKIKEVEKYLEELEEITPSYTEEYKKDFKTKAACERYFEKIIEAIVDLAFLVIKERKLKIPEEDKEAFDILLKESIINEQLTERLKEAKGMRNIISHEYGKVDDETVFNSITEEIQNDSKEFIKSIKNIMKIR